MTHNIIQRMAHFSVKGQIVNIFSSVSYMVSTTTIQFSFCTKAAIDGIEKNGCGWVPIKLYLQNQVAGCILLILLVSI